MEYQNIDHLFRHQFGKMVSSLTRIFGLEHLATIEDAVQDTFVQALKTWRKQMPDNPEAWLTQAAKNRAIDLFRKIKSDHLRHGQLYQGAAVITLSNVFTDHEIEDNQLRMIFTACHPNLDPRDQITFALKTISGFSTKEIAASLLIKEETIKKRLTRARQKIAAEGIQFEIPEGQVLPQRMARVHEVLYLIFNEGFQSIQQDMVIRKDLCSEAMRLSKLLIKKPPLRHPNSYALLALMCFHAARLDSKVNDQNQIVDLRHQDRSQWSYPLISVGNGLMEKAVENCENYSSYHYEAAIAFEHISAKTFEKTNWNKILHWYQCLDTIAPSPSGKLNMSITLIQMNWLEDSESLLNNIEPNSLGQRQYLYHGTKAELMHLKGHHRDAVTELNKAIELCANRAEKKYLKKRLNNILE